MKPKKGQFIYHCDDSPISDLSEIKVNYTYYPEEPMVRYYPDGSGYPGAPASVEIEVISIKINNVETEVNNNDQNFYNWFETISESIETSIIEEIQSEERDYDEGI